MSQGTPSDNFGWAHESWLEWLARKEKEEMKLTIIVYPGCGHMAEYEEKAAIEIKSLINLTEKRECPQCRLVRWERFKNALVAASEAGK